MTRIKTQGLLMVLALACTNAQAQRLSIGQLKAMIDALQMNVERLEEIQNQSPLAGFNCPSGLAVTSFDPSGQPVCTSPWPDAQPGEPLPYAFTCEDNYAQSTTGLDLKQAMQSALTELESSGPLVFENPLATATLSNLTLPEAAEITLTSGLVENNANQPCNDGVFIAYSISGLVLEGDIQIVSNGISELNSAFSLSLSTISIDLSAILLSPNADEITLPTSFGREVFQTMLESVQVQGGDLAMSGFDDPVTTMLMGNLLSNELAQYLAEQNLPLSQQILEQLPPPVIAHLTEL